MNTETIVRQEASFRVEVETCDNVGAATWWEANDALRSNDLGWVKRGVVAHNVSVVLNAVRGPSE